MWLGRLNRFLWLSLGALCLTGLYLSRKPLCIDSRTVERLDRVGADGTETVWACRLSRSAPWSQALFRRLPGWEHRIERIETALERIEPFGKPLRVVVLTERPWAFRLERGTLFIGDRMMEAGGHFERGLVKAWLAERDPNFASGHLVSEVSADLLYGMISGGLSLEDTERERRTRTGARWPLTLKDAREYCSSPWKLSEHYELCGKSPALLRDRAWRLSLRPLLSSALLSAWWDLPVRDRVELYGRLPEWAAAGVHAIAGTDREGLGSAIESVHAFQRSVVSKSPAVPSAAALAAMLDFKLRQAGFVEETDRMRLDVLVVSEMPLDAGSAWFRQLASFAGAHSSLKIAVKDPAGLTLLPARGRLRVDDLSNLQAQRVTVLRCGRFDFDWVLSFEPVAQRLFVVDACGSKLPDLRPWIAKDAESFALANKGFRFIQFHVPSLAKRKDSLNRATDVLTVIQKRDVSDPVFKTLGWQELNWFKTVDAYQPRAQLDAIEWFRLN